MPQQEPQEELIYRPLPDGTFGAFPKSMSDEEISDAIAKEYPQHGRAAAPAAPREPGRAPEKKEEDDSFWRQAAGTVGRQISGAGKAIAAPFSEAYRGYSEARERGAGLGEAAISGAGRMANQYLGDPAGLAEELFGGRGREEYLGRRAAGYGPTYSAFAPYAARDVGVNLPEMERQAQLGHPRGVLAEAAVPAAEMTLPAVLARRGERPPITEEEPLRELPRTRQGEPAPVAPGALPGVGLAAPTATSAADALARKMYGLPFELLTQEQKVSVIKQIGTGGPGVIGGPGGIEQRVTPGQSPTGLERRTNAMPRTLPGPGELTGGAAPPRPAIVRPGPTGEAGTLPHTGPPPPPPPTTLGGAAPPPRTLEEAAGTRRGPPAAEEKPPPPVAGPQDRLKTDFPDEPRVRQFGRVNGLELVYSGASFQAMQDVHNLTNVDIRQAAINSGIDLGQKHVGSRIGLGTEQISRQELIDQMIKNGVKVEDIPKLAQQRMWEYTRTMPVSGGRGNLARNTIVMHHEFGHGLAAGFRDVPQGGIISHRHPTADPSTVAATVIHEAEFRDAQGNYIRQKVIDNLDALIEMAAGGVAANEVLDGIPRDQNPGMRGDLRGANDLFNHAGITDPAEKEALWNAAIDRLVVKFRPLANIIREEAARREENLGVHFHVSEHRFNGIIERAKREGIEARNLEAAGQQTLWGGPGATVPGEGGPGAQQGIAGRKGAGAQSAAAPEKLKPYRPGKITFIFDIDEGNGWRRAQLDAVDVPQLKNEISKQFPNAYRVRPVQAIHPVPHPFERGTPQGFQTLPHVPEELVEHLTSDEIAAARARPLLQKNFVKAYNALIPTLKEIVNMMRAGHGLGGWWDRYVDALETMGAHNEAADMQNLTQTHAEALKAFHGAVSGNKSIEQANIIAWGAYRDWLRAGRPTDMPAIRQIIKANHGFGNLDARKLHSLVNSPQFREGVPMTSDAWINSPVAGKKGALKIPSMVGTSAGPGGRGPENLMRTVIDRHMLDLYGKTAKLTEAQYLAISVHLRQAADALGLAARDGQGQSWGTVLGLKELRDQKMSPAQAAQAFGKDILRGVGKDYAQNILEAADENPRVRQALMDLQQFGMDTGNPATIQRLQQIVQEGQKRFGERARPINRQLLQRSATRIWRSMKARPKRGAATE